MDLLTYISDMPRRIALAEACGTSPEYLWQIATRWRGKRPSPALAALIEAESTRLGPEMVPKEPMIFGPAGEAPQGTTAKKPSARAVFGPASGSLVHSGHCLAHSGVSKRALRQRLGFAADAPLAKLLRLPLEQVAAWPDDEPMPALPQVLQLLGRGEEPADPSARPDPDAGRIVAVEGA